MQNVDVSVIIVNWNTRDSLQECLTSVYRETDGLTFETIVVDNASCDSSSHMVKANFPQVVLVENQENRGFAAANNQGIQIAKGRYILLLNSDTVVLDNAIAKTVRYADQDPDVAVVGCQVWETPDRIQMTCFRYPSLTNLILSVSGLAKMLKHNKFYGREWMLWWGRDTERQVDVVSGMFMLVRREAIEKVGVMDEVFFIYCEEADWCYRFSKAGWKMLFWPGAKIIHVDGGSHSSNQRKLEMFVQEQKSVLLFFKKNVGRTGYLLAHLIMIFSFGLRVCFCAILLIPRKIISKITNNELYAVQKNWMAFKFCAFGVEPKQTGH